MSSTMPRVGLRIGGVPWFVAQNLGACARREVDPRWFEPSFGEPTDDWLGVDKARAVCRSCPVLLDCRTFAVANKNLEGLWGDTTPAERKELRRAS